MANRRKRISITQAIMSEVIRTQKDRQHDLTRKQYIRDCKRFICYCRERYNCRSFDECKAHIRDYAQYLFESGYAASTIHCYLAAVGAVFNISLSEIPHPVRHTAEYIRGRKKPAVPTSKNDFSDPRHIRLCEFQQRVGIRRRELAALTGDCFVQDESGHWCVLVKHGKGNKRQLNRLNSSEDIAFIRSYFTAKQPTEKIFSHSEIKNDLNLHALRAQSAKEYYHLQLHRIQNETGYAEKLEQELRRRWQVACRDKRTGKPRPFPEKEIRGYYTLRGKNRKLALRKGLPLSYHRLAVMATSVFKLSHFRINVAVHSYLLAT